MYHYRDPLAELTDEDLFSGSSAPLCSAEFESRYSAWEWARYDWSAFNPIEYGYQVIRLQARQGTRRKVSPHSGKYFTIVDLDSYEWLTSLGQWYPLVEYYRDERGEKTSVIKRISAHRNSGPRDNRKLVYMARILVEARHSTLRDHINGHSLDNRLCNLRPFSWAANACNVRKKRATDLKAGVEYRNKSKTLVGGVIEISGRKIRSPETWPLAKQDNAHEWYNAKRSQIFKAESWVNTATTVSLPQFPPLKPLYRPEVIQRSIESIGDTF